MFAGVPREMLKPMRLSYGPENLLGRFKGSKEIQKQLRQQSSAQGIHTIRKETISSSTTTRTSVSEERKVRMKPGAAFAYPSEEVHLDKWQARRTFKVLGYHLDVTGVKLLYDIRTGEKIKSGCLRKARVNKNIVTFDTKEAAIMEQINNTLPRVLATFDCWGTAKRRHGGSLSSLYEFGRFVKIVEILDAPPKADIRATSPINKKHIHTERDDYKSSNELEIEFINKVKNSRSSVLQNVFFYGYKSTVNELKALCEERETKKKAAKFAF